MLVLTHALGAHARELAAAGWEVLPLAPSKLPLLAKSPACRASGCKGRVDGCQRDGHGLHDATSDAAIVERWWRASPHALIGARVPASVLVLDVDPRHRGQEHLEALEGAHEPLPPTLTVFSGREDGGRHLYYGALPGPRVPTEAGMRDELRRLGVLDGTATEMGLDLKVGGRGYCVVPPSPHPATGLPYRWDLRPIVEVPGWLRRLLLPAVAIPPTPTRSTVRLGIAGPSIADAFCAATSWADLLGPAGWAGLDPDGDRDGARWRHPAASTQVSATVRHGCLFVYTPNTPLPVSAVGDPHGVTKFRAYALLEHAGDMSAAARALRAGRAVAA